MTRFDSDWDACQAGWAALPVELLPKAGVWETVLSDVPIVRAADPEVDQARKEAQRVLRARDLGEDPTSERMALWRSNGQLSNGQTATDNYPSPSVAPP